MNNIEFMRAAVRPFMILSGWLVILLMVVHSTPPPEWLRYTVITFSSEYVVERGIRHLKGQINA